MKKGCGNKMIDSIKGTFLSNFWEVPIVYMGLTYRNAESAYQASKCADSLEKLQFCNLSGAQAKAKGRQVKMVEDFCKLNVMKDILLHKFEQNPDLLTKLLATDNEEIQEGNTWRDTFWGVCNGKGQNQLGKLLMVIREEYK
jgi:ribA/ribD-fused uncharacterized protein